MADTRNRDVQRKMATFTPGGAAVDGAACGYPLPVAVGVSACAARVVAA